MKSELRESMYGTFRQHCAASSVQLFGHHLRSFGFLEYGGNVDSSGISTQAERKNATGSPQSTKPQPYGESSEALPVIRDQTGRTPLHWLCANETALTSGLLRAWIDFASGGAKEDSQCRTAAMVALGLRDSRERLLYIFTNESTTELKS